MHDELKKCSALDGFIHEPYLSRVQMEVAKFCCYSAYFLGPFHGFPCAGKCFVLHS